MYGLFKSNGEKFVIGKGTLLVCDIKAKTFSFGNIAPGSRVYVEKNEQTNELGDDKLLCECVENQFDAKQIAYLIARTHGFYVNVVYANDSMISWIFM